MAKRWIGDLSTCFLLEDGWAFRLKVNRFQRDGRPGWRMPASIGDALGLELGDRVLLPCADERIPHTLVLERTPDALVGSEIDLPLRRSDAKDDDLAFFVFRPDSYRLVVRHRTELDPGDALGSLLWHCGLDPADDAIRADPWRRIVRAVGGTGDSPAAVADRLQARGDKRLGTLLDEAAAQKRDIATASSWSAVWQYVLPDQTDDIRFVLQRGDGSVRVALGVLDGTAQPPRELTLGDGGTIWLTLGPADDLERVDAVLQSPPAGLIPSGARPGWAHWMRADHAGRRAALLGRHWRLERAASGWRDGEEEVDRLQDALLRLRVDGPDPAPEPRGRAKAGYPRNGLGFNALVREAAARGLEALEAERDVGYRATFNGGRVKHGVSLVDVLAD